MQNGMDVQTFRENESNAKEMSKANRVSLEKFLNDTRYSEADKELFSLLLKENKILEQEGISLSA